MKNIVYYAIKEKGPEYFENAWSPIFGDAKIHRADDSSKTIEVIDRGDILWVFDGDGKYCQNGEIMLFPYKGADESSWDEYVDENTVLLNKMEDNPEFSESDIERVKNALYGTGVKPLRYYLGNSEDEIIEKKLNIMSDAVDALDFEKINSVMEHTDWEWKTIGAVPTEGELKYQCTRMLQDVLSHDDKSEWFESTGGFDVGFRVYPPDNINEDDFDHCVDVYARFTLEEFSLF